MDLRKACFNFYWTAQKIIVPTLKHSQTIYEEVLFSHSNNASNWLDLGCGHQLLPSWRLEQERSITKKVSCLTGLDYDYYSLHNHRTIKHLVQGDISRLPFVAETFDLVTANMVFEHLSNPENQLREIFRILKPGGSLVFHTPNAMSYGAILARLVPESLKAKVIWFFQQRMEEDIFPALYKINTERSIRELAARVGFDVTTLHLIESSAEFIMIPPVVIIELLLIRLLMMSFARRFRANIIAVLTKPSKSTHPVRRSLRESATNATQG
jgi:ubiquinone/menaquinone biosynthesis C-methylase UbiE